MNNKNFNEILKELKKKINISDEKKENKNSIIEEIKDLSELLNKVRLYISDIEKQYVIEPTAKLKKEIEDYKKQEQDYVDLINEYAKELRELDIDIDDNYQQDKEFLKLAIKFQEISKQLKKIEQSSKKFGNKKIIGTNRVKTENAEGRIQYIHQNLLTEYEKLVKEKKAILSEYRKQYKDFIARYQDSTTVEASTDTTKIEYYNNERLGIAPTYIPTDEEYTKMSKQEMIELENKYYNDMSIEEKISYCEDIINIILSSKNTGKKEYIHIDQKCYYVPKKMKSLFYDYYKKLKKLKNIEPIENKIIKIDEIQETETITSEIFIEDQYEIGEKKSLKEEIKDDSESDYNLNEHIYLPLDGIIDSEAIEPKFIYYGNSLKDGQIFNVREIEEINKEEDEIVYAYSYFNSEHNNINKSKRKIIKNHDDDKHKITKIRKAKNRNGLAKRIAAAVLAIAASLTIAQGIKSLINNNSTKAYSSHSISDEIDANDNSKKDSSTIDDIVDKITDNNNKEFKDTNRDIRIGDTVTIKEGSLIFSNVYDAMTKDNGKTAYFPSSKQRSVIGIFMKCDNRFFYCENQSEIDNLIRKNGTVQSYMIGDGGYEGAFHHDDVVLQKSLKGKIR